MMTMISIETVMIKLSNLISLLWLRSMIPFLVDLALLFTSEKGYMAIFTIVVGVIGVVGFVEGLFPISAAAKYDVVRRKSEWLC